MLGVDRLRGSLDAIAALSPALAVREAAPLLASALGGAGVSRQVERAVRGAPGRGDAPTFETLARADGWSLELFVWPTGAATPIHDHSTWGLYVCLAGRLGEERYARLDDEARVGLARLKREWQAIWRPLEQSSLMPYAGGIHRVHNAGLEPAVSVHLYGPAGVIDGRDYDARREFVCDRPLLVA